MITKFDFSIFYHLIQYEFMDNIQTIYNFINNLIPDLYNDDDYEIKTSRDQIEKSHFDGNFNNDPLLKFMLAFFTPKLVKEQLEDQKWFPDNNSKFNGSYCFILAILKVHSKANCTIDDISFVKDHFDNSNYMSTFTIELLSRNEQLKFRLHNSTDLVDTLRIIERVGMPQGVLVRDIIRFQVQNVWKWDESIFTEFLQKEISHPKYTNKLFQEEYDRFIKLVE